MDALYCFNQTTVYYNRQESVMVILPGMHGDPIPGRLRLEEIVQGFSGLTRFMKTFSGSMEGANHRLKIEELAANSGRIRHTTSAHHITIDIKRINDTWRVLRAQFSNPSGIVWKTIEYTFGDKNIPLRIKETITPSQFNVPVATTIIEEYQVIDADISIAEEKSRLSGFPLVTVTDHRFSKPLQYLAKSNLPSDEMILQFRDNPQILQTHNALMRSMR
jgi:hypothetical protein